MVTEDDGGSYMKKLGGWVRLGNRLVMKARGWMEY